jgi:hypothetical protein
MLPAMSRQHWANELKDIARNDLVSFAVRMNSIGLHPFGMLIHMQQQERHISEVKLLSQIGEHGREGFHVIGSVVRRERDAEQHDRDAGVLELLDHFLQVLSSGLDRNATQAVVTAELENHQGRVFRDDVLDTGQAIAGGVATYALVVYPKFKAILIEQVLQVIRIAAACYSSREAIAESHDDRTMIGLRWSDWGGRGGTGSGRFTFFLRRGFFTGATGDGNSGVNKAGCHNE